MSPEYTRHEALAHRVHQRYHSSAFDKDPVYRASIKMVRDMLIATDEALAAEGVDEVIRDRVAYRLLYNEAPHTYPVPDSREALARLRARDEQLATVSARRGWVAPREGGYTSGQAGAPPPPPKGTGGVAHREERR